MRGATIVVVLTVLAACGKSSTSATSDQEADAIAARKATAHMLEETDTKSTGRSESRSRITTDGSAGTRRCARPPLLKNGAATASS